MLRYLPDQRLLDELLTILVPGDHLKKITPLETLRDNTESIRELLIERILIREDIWVGDTSEYPHLVQAVSNLFFRKRGDPHLLHGVLLPVFPPLDLVDDGKRSLAQLGDHCVLVHLMKY